MRLAEFRFVFQVHFLLPELTVLDNILPIRQLVPRDNQDTRSHPDCRAISYPPQPRSNSWGGFLGRHSSPNCPHSGERRRMLTD
jgi:hypothetical protein